MQVFVCCTGGYRCCSSFPKFFVLLRSVSYEVQKTIARFTVHTCQPSRSRRDSPDLKTETRRPARRPKKADSSRFVPTNAPKHDLNLLFACSLCSLVGIQVSFVSFGLFSCTRPWQAVSYPNKKIRTALFWLKSSFSCHFPLNARNFA